MITPEIIKQHGISESEYAKIKELIGREPNINELGMFSVLWSEHCSYKNSKVVLKTLPTTGKQVLQGPGENAGIVDIGDGWAVSFKIESHNHPSAIEPYQGAATGVGGILRDVFTMGARPIAMLNSLRFGNPNNAATKHIIDGVVKGIGGYGNAMGIPTVGGEVFFDDTYEGNPLVNAMCVGLLRTDEIYKSTISGIGNPVIIVGAKTGRDGIHGATFASTELSEESKDKRPSVQVGDPFTEKLLLEACMESFKTDVIVGIQDMGAAGLTSSSCEMAAKSNVGLEFDTALVPQRESNMTPYEILLSESQERMLLVAQAGKEQVLFDIFKKYGLDYAVIGKVTDTKHVVVKHNGEVVVDVPATAFTDECPMYNRTANEPKYLAETRKVEIKAEDKANYNEDLMKLLSSPNLCSRKWVYRQFDHEVGLSTVVKPGSDAAVVRIKGTNKAIAATVDCNSRYMYLNPEAGGQCAVAEAALNIACSGAKPLAITDGCNFGSPENPEIFWQFKQTLKGIGDACIVLDTPIIGGNVSLYNENKISKTAIYPSPMVGMVGVLDDYNNVVTSGFKNEGDVVFLINTATAPSLSGSEYAKTILNVTGGDIQKPELYDVKAVINALQMLSHNQIISSAHDVSDGGLAVALFECCTGGVGANIKIETTTAADLFGENIGRVIVSVQQDKIGEFENMTDNLPVLMLGTVGGNRLTINKNVVDVELSAAIKEWGEAFGKLVN